MIRGAIAMSLGRGSASIGSGDPTPRKADSGEKSGRVLVAELGHPQWFREARQRF